MTAVGLALLCALAYGSSDFVAGLTSRRMHYARVGLLGQLAATVAVWAAVPFTGGSVTTRALVWGALSGIGGGVGTVALYRGLARGQMAVAGPVSAAGAAVVPVVAGLLFGERPSAVTLAGVVVVVPAIWLISSGSSDGDGAGDGVRRGGLVEGAVDGLVAGLGFGLLFLGLGRAGHGSGLWPTAFGQVTSLAVVVLFAAATRGRVRGPGGTTPQRLAAVGSGVLSAVATVTYLLSARFGLIVVVAVLASLYPGVTVLLARVVLHERMSRWQLAGLAVAAAGIVAITVG
ncbi:MAG: EamA family transporter [Streptosporangiales bacterium]|nr:EamA family transporter [Streptosporangiales bacterium]MBO0890621.1 EamA family transporter [Acidothermales bacterium]